MGHWKTPEIEELNTEKTKRRIRKEFERREKEKRVKKTRKDWYAQTDDEEDYQ